jgi:3D-(3,5/4)-trihydroxycyclohexane-1,2-dione acylhydrolase (decyclizing)
VGGGGRKFADGIRALAEAAGAVTVLSLGSVGVLPNDHSHNMHVGGSKGSISGNYAMENATLLIAIGTRAVCQSDCSGIGYPAVRDVINFNGDLDDVAHYNHTLPLVGDIGANLTLLLAALADQAGETSPGKRAWLDACAARKAEWAAFKQARFAARPPLDETWQRHVMTQPQAIKVAADFARETDAAKLFDAGDVQANGFQLVEDDRPFDTFTESGASYMGFASAALMASALADMPRYTIAFSGDGSFLMNPQVLLDGVEHGLDATLIIFDNRRMAAISNLQLAQYGAEFRTNDGVAVDYQRMAGAFSGVLALWGGDTPETLREALVQARAYRGLSVIHVPVYGGRDPVGGLGVYGAWNVGDWVEAVEQRYVETRI